MEVIFMALQKKSRIGLIIAAAAVVLVGIGIGAYFGATQKHITPASESYNETSKGAVSGTSEGTGAAAAASTEAPKLVTLKTSTKKNCSSTPYVVGERKGFFAEEGLNVEYTGELTTAQELPAVLNGTNDFTGALPNSLATYVAGGAAVKAVTMSVIDPPEDVDPKFRHMRFYVSPKSGVKTWTDFLNYKKGEKLTISGTVPSCSSFIPSQIFDHFSLDRTRLQFVTLETDTAAIQAAQQGNLDIAGIHPPFYRLAGDSGLVLVGDSADSGLGPAAGVSVFYFRDDFIAANPDPVQRFVNAIKKAQDWANNNTDESVALTAEYIGKEVTATHYYYTGKGFPENFIQPWIDDLVASNALKKDQIKVTDLITNQFQ
jgi:ABC-type nitrate/sulfonate/bicarbonate transport system substrate-binding protein